MMDFINSMPIWQVAVGIFCLRLVDVSMGTIRTISVVNGATKLAVFLGFWEVTIWLFIVSQVIARIHESVILVFAYAAGFATGNAIGIFLEKRAAFGVVVLRMISSNEGGEIAEALRKRGHILTTFNGEGRDGVVKLLIISCERKVVGEIIDIAQSIDPHLFYIVERANEWSHVHHKEKMHTTGLRSIMKKK